VVSKPGRAFDTVLRSRWERRVGADLSPVRLHDDAEAAASADRLHADAWAVGPHVAFGRGRFSPGTAAGDRLLEHELRHVAQQRSATPSDVAAAVSRPVTGDAAAESGADAAGAVSARPVAVVRQARPGRITEVELSCADSRITFHGESGDTSYALTRCDLTDGEYDAGVGISGHDVRFDLGTQAAEGLRFDFAYRVDPGQVSPDQLLRGQSRVRVRARSASAGAAGREVFEVRVVDAAQFQLMTGRPLTDLPEGRPVTPESLIPGAGFGALRTPLPFPRNTTGLLITPGHVTDLAAAGGEVSAFGFRSYFNVHARAWLERRTGRTGGDMSYMLNAGRSPASYMNDWFYPYLPGARLVHRGAMDQDVAAGAAEFLRSREGAYGNQPYTHSEPPAGGPAAERLAREGRVCGPGQNCVTVPAAEHQRMLGPRANPAEIATGAHPPGAIRNATEWAERPAERLAARGLTSTPVTLGMGVRFLIRSGGRVLLVYGAYHSAERIADAPEGRGAIVVGEEAGSWVGGWVGAALASAGFGALLCAETGIGAVVCGAAFGLAGGITGSVVGEDIGHDVGERVQAVGDMLRNPEQLIRASTWMIGTPAQIREYEDWRAFENPDEPSPLDFE
jgi:hypothetical protein